NETTTSKEAAFTESRPKINSVAPPKSEIVRSEVSPVKTSDSESTSTPSTKSELAQLESASEKTEIERIIVTNPIASNRTEFPPVAMESTPTRKTALKFKSPVEPEQMETPARLEPLRESPRSDTQTSGIAKKMPQKVDSTVPSNLDQVLKSFTTEKSYQKERDKDDTHLISSAKTNAASEKEDDSVGFATTRRGRTNKFEISAVKQPTSQLFQLFDMSESIEDHPIFSETKTEESGDDVGFARSGQYSK
ncbi:MAG: hypothetical protein ACRCUY_04610, partial [Thermoguttaceae bacterium]